MTLAARLHPASFRGIPFLWISESSEAGQKIALHEYPNSDERYAEPLGKKPPIYTIEALLHGPDVANQRVAFEDALNIRGTGKLVHPIYGDLDVTALDYVVNSAQTTIGEVRFSIRFATTQPATPEPIEFTESALVKVAVEAREVVDELFADGWIDPISTENQFSNVEKARAIWTKISDSVKANVNLLKQAAATFNANVRRVSRLAYGVIRVGNDIKDANKLILASALAVVSTPAQLKKAWESLTQENILPIGFVSSSIDQRSAQNNVFLTEHLRLNALINSYEASVFTDYTTDVELEETKSFLNTSYTEFLLDVVVYLKRSNLISFTENNIPLQDVFNQLRNLSEKLFNDKDKNIYQIKEIDVEKTSILLLTYKYYGNLDLLSAIKTLNPDINHANFSGKVKILVK